MRKKAMLSTDGDHVTNFYDNDPSAAVANLLTELEGFLAQIMRALST